MKRKLFSTILFGALLTASTSGLTSCKDYDDDISNLQSQIDKLATADQLSAKVTELQGQIAQAKSDAIDAANAAKQVADNALKAAQDAATKGDVEAAKAAAAAAQKTVDDLKASGVSAAAINAAQEAADKANAAIAEAIEKGTPVIEGLNKAIEDLKAAEEEHTKAINDLDKELNGEGGIAERLAAAEKAIEEGANIDLTELTKLLEEFEAKAKEILGTAFVMVTDVELYVTAWSNELGYDTDLKFWKVKELADITFPDDKETGEDTFTFTKDNVRLFDDKLIVRVSPIDATLTPEMITLINSQGAEVSKDLVEITSVEPYETLLTRGASNNGLWTVNFKVADNKQDELNAIAKKKIDGVYKNILFAVAVNNTQDVADTRRVISAYDVIMNSDEPDPATLAQLKINDTDVTEIHNRITSTEQGQAVSEKEYSWANSTPAVTPIYKGNNVNVVEAAAPSTGDYRQNKPILVVELNKDIKIDFDDDNTIRGFYVTTDYKRAVESGNTEINAWNSYKYENVGTYKNDGTQLIAAKLQEGNHGTIKVLDLAAMAMVGDVIGFRVFAINLDGTLVDPDGIPFYVGIGGASQADEKVLPAQEALIEFNSTETGTGDFKKNVTAIVDASGVLGVDFDEVANIKCSKGVDNVTPKYSDRDFTIGWYNKTSKTFSTTRNAEKDLAIKILNPMKFVDEQTYTISFDLMKNISSGAGATAGQYKVRTVKIDVKKVMPKQVPVNVIYNALQNSELLMGATAYNNVTVDLTNNTNNTRSVRGEINLVKFLIYDDENNTKLGEIANHDKYSYKLETSKWNANAEAYVDALVADDGNSYKVSVDNGLIDGKTSHSINAVYTYTNISRRFKDGAWTVDSSNDANWVLTAAQEPTVIYCSWSKQSNDFTRFAFHSGKYNNGNQNNPDWKYRTANQIQWAASYTAGSEVALTGALDLSTVKVKYGLKAQVAGISYTTLKDLITYGYLKLIDAYTSANGVKNAYIKPVVNSNGSFGGFKQVAEKTIDHSETLVLKVVDCFNYKQAIELPIQIVSNADNDMSIYTTDTTFE